MGVSGGEGSIRLSSRFKALPFDALGFRTLFKSADFPEVPAASRPEEQEDCASPPTSPTPFRPFGQESGAKEAAAKPPSSPISPPLGFGCHAGRVGQGCVGGVAESIGSVGNLIK